MVGIGNGYVDSTSSSPEWTNHFIRGILKYSACQVESVERCFRTCLTNFVGILVRVGKGTRGFRDAFSEEDVLVHNGDIS